MTTSRSGKIWLGIGAVALLGAGNATSAQAGDVAQPSTHMHGKTADQASKAPPAGAGEAAGSLTAKNAASQGGEGGEGAGAGLDPRVKFNRDMGLVRGHLMVGDELVKLGRWADALPHFHHPIEELYPGLAPKLKQHKLGRFDAALKALAQTVMAKDSAAYAAALAVVDKRMSAVDKATKGYSSPATGSVMRTVMAMLATAAGEYGAAIENGRIAKPVEYQDARGFVWHGERLLKADAMAFEAKDKPAFVELLSAYTQLKSAWPAAVPPDKPVKSAAAVLADIARIELAAASFLYQ